MAPSRSKSLRLRSSNIGVRVGLAGEDPGGDHVVVVEHQLSDARPREPFGDVATDRATTPESDLFSRECESHRGYGVTALGHLRTKLIDATPGDLSNVGPVGDELLDLFAARPKRIVL